MEKILDMRTRRSQKQYLIRWKGYSDAHDSWEPWENIKAPLLMAEFKKQRSARKEGDAQEQPKVQKGGRRGAIRVIRLDTNLQTQVKMCNRTPPTPARSITPESPFIPSPPSSMSSNSRAVHYVTAAVTPLGLSCWHAFLLYLYSAIYDSCELIMCTTGSLDAHTGHFRNLDT